MRGVDAHIDNVPSAEMILAVRVLSKRTERSSVPVFVVMPAADFIVNVVKRPVDLHEHPHLVV